MSNRTELEAFFEGCQNETRIEATREDILALYPEFEEGLQVRGGLAKMDPSTGNALRNILVVDYDEKTKLYTLLCVIP